MIRRSCIKKTRTEPIHYFSLEWQISETNSNFPSEEKIPYDKRIHLLKASKSTKEKAFDKLKELNSSKGESNAKAQQYLDGLLRIPFGVYCREPILQKLSELKTEFSHLVSQDSNEDNDSNEPVMNSAIEKYIKTTKCFALYRLNNYINDDAEILERYWCSNS